MMLLLSRYEQARPKSLKRPFDYDRSPPIMSHAKRPYNPAMGQDGKRDDRK